MSRFSAAFLLQLPDNRFIVNFYGGFMRFSPLIACVFLLLPAFSSASAMPAKLEIFYDKPSDEIVSRTLANIELKYFRLDDAARLQQSIKLPAKLEDAAKFMRRYVISPVGKKKIQQIVVGYQGVARAFSLGIKALPAVVIDEHYVVYGSTDTRVAIDAWRAYQAQRAAP